MIKKLSGAIVLFFTILSYGQTVVPGIIEERGEVRIMFYNVENFFDTINDSLTLDDEFLPAGRYGWTEEKCWKKANQIFKTIASVGGTKPPEIVGFAEIENKSVLQRLAYGTPLSKYSWKIVHYESPDLRGIDVGLIYRDDILQLLSSGNIRIHFPDQPGKKTRDILYCTFRYGQNEIFHLFINHWPSRRGGEKKSESSRVFVASVLKNKTDSILRTDPAAKIIITGDFNDEPENSSILSGLEAGSREDRADTGNLYNLSAVLKQQCNCGTYRYRNTWNMFDQFMVSGSLIAGSGGLSTCWDCVHIAAFDFLMTEDTKYGGYKPYRTYTGPSYRGGFSDHLPVYLDLFLQ